MLNKGFLRILTSYGRCFSTATSAAKKISSENRTTQLKQMLLSPKLEFIMEAHSALSAKIVEETGFKVRIINHNSDSYLLFINFNDLSSIKQHDNYNCPFHSLLY